MGQDGTGASKASHSGWDSVLIPKYLPLFEL